MGSTRACGEDGEGGEDGEDGEVYGLASGQEFWMVQLGKESRRNLDGLSRLSR
jgi:hypothetical protein